ncbi:MAG: outer membrane beta-barrel protein [Rhodomicrobium sp.]
MFRRIVLVSVSVIALSAAASAADMYVQGPAGPGGYKDGPSLPVATWTGFYMGVNGGYAWSSENQERDPSFANQPGGVPFGGISPSGGFGGGQLGYNWQGWLHPNLVLGVEADFQGSDISDRALVPFFGTLYDLKSNLDYFGTVRGRIGYSMDRALLYFTGGFAYGGLHKSSDDWGVPFPAQQTFNGIALGYVLGGGLEYKISPAWSMKMEYQYLNFSKNDLCGGGNPLCFSAPAQSGPQHDDAYHTVRVGLNYHIGPSYEPLK